MLVRAPYSFFFIFMICYWFRHNAAVPLADHLSNQMQDAFKGKKTDSKADLDDTTLNSRSIREMKSLDVNEDDENYEIYDDEDDDENDENDEIQNTISNVNRNTNINLFNPGKRRLYSHEHVHKQSTTEDITAVTEHGTSEEIAREEASTNCAISNKKKQRYSSSFFENTTDHALTVEKEFHNVVGNNSKVKKSGSVHEGEDITLCWIETTTIKEDKTIRPAKRLVIREYTISFENSATIPERYLECKRYEGELTANDPDVGKTALFEVIDEDTMVSRIVNFTSVSHIGNVTIWQHKKVKCGVGPVVSKNIIELEYGSKNPKKRVEIKVSPKMHKLTATTTDEGEPCTEGSAEIEETGTFTESTEHTTGLSCENGVCGATAISPSISTKNGEVSTVEETTKLQSKTESGSEEVSTVTKSLTLPEEVSRRSTTFPKISTTIQEHKEKIDCEENSSDPACLQESSTSSLEGFFPNLSTKLTTETATIVETSSIPISDKELTTEEEISLSSVEDRSKETTSSFTREEKKVTSDLVTEETTPLMNQASVDGSTSSETDIMTSHSVAEEYSKSEESTSDSFTELPSKEINKIHHVSSSSIYSVTSGEVDTDITTTIPVEFTEFTKGPDKPGQSLDKLTEPPISTEGVTESIIIESSSTSEEVPSKESKESVTSAIEETTIGLRTSTEGREFSSATKTSPAEIESTTPAISNEISYSCENSEECVSSSETCEESGNCDKEIVTTAKCDSEVCSEEETTDDQSKFDTSLPPIITKHPSSTQSSERPTMTETQYTTVANVATTMLTSQEGENNSTAVNNVPITMDTRRSTTTSTPRHKLTLKVKVLLEHINENKEKHNLVEVEKHLSLDENPEHHSNPDLLEQLKSLNASVNMETMSALLNCTSLGNLTRDFVSVEPDDAIDGNDDEFEFTNSDLEDSLSEQLASGYADAKNDYSEYEEQEVSSRRRRRRSLDNEMKELNGFIRRYLHDPTDSVVDPFNISESQQTELIKDSLQLSTTTNYTEEETTEYERNVTTGGEESMPSTVSIADLSNATESHDANLTKEDIQLITTTNKPEEETSNAVYVENGKNITSERNESALPPTKENISNETTMEVIRETLPGIQEDVAVGLQHMVSQLAQNNLTAINNIKETVKTNLLGILADPKDTRVRSRRRRAATEEVGHWSNERIKEAPMGGNLRSLTEFTLYKVLP